MKKILFLTLAWLGAATLHLVAQTPGSLDTSFGNQGFILTPISNDFGVGVDIAVQPDRKIIACGLASDSTDTYTHGVMIRYMPDGKGLDSTFGVNGIVHSYIDTAICPGGSNMRNPSLLADGRILVSVGGNFLTLCLLPDGRRDSSFQGTGLTYINPSLTGADALVAGGMTLQPDGKIVHVGTARFQLPSGAIKDEVMAVRFNADGSLDTTFGPSNQGYAITNLGSVSARAYNAFIQSDGKIILVGNYGIYSLILRYLADGSKLDSTFGVNGVVKKVLGNESSFRFAVQQGDGKIVIGVDAVSPQTLNYDVGLMRFLPDGNLDNSFGNNGSVIKQISLAGSSIVGSLLQPDNKIALTAYFWDATNPQLSHSIFMRYNEDGSEDTSFPVSIDYSGFGFHLNLDNEGKILGVGGGSAKVGVCRFFSGLELGLAPQNNPDLGLRLFPNPSTQSINIRYNLSNRENVSISLWDNQGRKIQTLLENQLEQTGEHTHLFDLPSNLHSDIYLIQIQTGKGIYTAKVIK